MAKSKKKQESEELLAPDPFLQNADKLSETARKHAPLVLGIVAVILVAVVVVEYVRSSSARDASTMTAQLGTAIDAYNEATDLRTVLTSTSAETLNKSFEGSKKKFKQVRDDHPNSAAATLAALYEGDLAYRLQKYDEAAELFEIYLKNSGPDDVLRFRALEGAGYAYEGAKKLDEALTKFKTLSETEEFYKDFGLKHRARILEKQGNTKDAIAAYQEIADMTESPLKTFAEERLRALQ